MEGVYVSKKLQYKPVDQDVIDQSLIMTEYVNLLQLAGQIAAEGKSPAKVLKVAKQWFKLLVAVEPEEEEKPPTPAYGFGKTEEPERGENHSGTFSS